MTATTMNTSSLQDTKVAGLVADMRQGSPLLWRSTILMLALAAVLAAAHLFDSRQLIGVSVWDKPMKFAIAIAVQFATVSWAMAMLPEESKAARIAALLMAFCGWSELAYITTRGALGLTSHFNYDTVLSSVAYALMGLGAVTMTATSFLIGTILWRRAGQGLWPRAAALGLMLGSLLATCVAGYLSSRGGHWVGGEMTDANGLGFFHWSTTGGDLRVAHFVGLHAAQAVPLAALSGRHSVVYVTAILVTLATAAAFIQALMGIPLLQG